MYIRLLEVKSTEVHDFSSYAITSQFILWLHCKTHFFRLLPKNSFPLLFCGSTHRCSPTFLFKGFTSFCTGEPMCSPVIAILFDFMIMSMKWPFLQWNHFIYLFRISCFHKVNYIIKKTYLRRILDFFSEYPRETTTEWTIGTELFVIAEILRTTPPH